MATTKKKAAKQSPAKSAAPVQEKGKYKVALRLKNGDDWDDVHVEYHNTFLSAVSKFDLSQVSGKEVQQKVMAGELAHLFAGIMEGDKPLVYMHVKIDGTNPTMKKALQQLKKMGKL